MTKITKEQLTEKFKIGKTSSVEQVIVYYSINDASVVLVTDNQIYKSAMETKIINLSNFAVEDLAVCLLDIIVLYKPKKIIMGAIGMGIALWDYMIEKLVQNGVYINREGDVTYGLTPYGIISVMSKDNNTMYQRYAVNIREKKVQELLEFSYENRILVKLTSEELRGAGKSASLLKMADEKELSIITTNLHHFHMLESLREELGLNLRGNIVYARDAKSFEGNRLDYHDFLIDEGTDMTIIKNVVKNGHGNLVGGWDRM